MANTGLQVHRAPKNTQKPQHLRHLIYPPIESTPWSNSHTSNTEISELSKHHSYVLAFDFALHFYYYQFSHIMTDGPGHNPFAGSSQQAPLQGHNPPTGSPQRSLSWGSEPHGTDEPAREDEHQALHTELSSLISEYWEKRLSKSKAFSRIGSLIDEDAMLSDSKKEKAINLYVDELNSIKHSDQNQLFTIPTPEKEKNNQWISTWTPRSCLLWS